MAAVVKRKCERCGTKIIVDGRKIESELSRENSKLKQECSMLRRRLEALVSQRKVAEKNKELGCD